MQVMFPRESLNIEMINVDARRVMISYPDLFQMQPDIARRFVECTRNEQYDC